MADTHSPHVDPHAASVGASLTRLRARADEAVRTIDLDVAADLYEACAVLGSACGAQSLATESLAGSAYVAHLRGDLGRATELYAKALEATEDREARAQVRARMGFARYDQGDLDAAREELDRALDDAVSASLRARVIGFVGNVARASGDYAQASRLYAEASARLDEAGDRRFAATFAMDRAITSLLEGAPARALPDLEALARDETASDPLLGALVGHYRSLARAALGMPAEEVDLGKLPMGEYLSRARLSLADRRAVDLDALQAEAPSNAHARATLEIVLRALGNDANTPRALVVSRHGSFFQLGDAPLVMLTQRSPLARMLVALAEARVASPGKSIADEELVARAWPGERMLPASQRNRLHVAISTLRKLGLRPAIERRDEGYLVARDVNAVLVD